MVKSFICFVDVGLSWTPHALPHFLPSSPISILHSSNTVHISFVLSTASCPDTPNLLGKLEFLTPPPKKISFTTLHRYTEISSSPQAFYTSWKKFESENHQCFSPGSWGFPTSSPSPPLSLGHILWALFPSLKPSFLGPASMGST